MFDIFFHFANVKKHPQCENCGAKFAFLDRLCRKCCDCDTYICYNCLKSMEASDTQYFPFPLMIEGKYCGKCYDIKIKPVVDKIQDALSNFQKVELFSENYKGEVAVPGSQKQMIQTVYFKDRDDTDKSLKLIASFIKCDLVYKVHYDKKKERKGNYDFTTWSATGVPAIRKVERK